MDNGACSYGRFLDGTGDRIISREDLKMLIGETGKALDYEYGVGIEMPMS